MYASVDPSWTELDLYNIFVILGCFSLNQTESPYLYQTFCFKTNFPGLTEEISYQVIICFNSSISVVMVLMLITEVGF